MDTLPAECTTMSKSVIIRTALDEPTTIHSGNARAPDLGTVAIPQGTTETIKDPEIPSFPDCIGERMKGFYVDWDEEERHWIADDVFTGDSRLYFPIDPSNLLSHIDKFKTFVESFR